MKISPTPLSMVAIAALLVAPSTAFAATSVKLTAKSYGERVSMTVPMDTLAEDNGAAAVYDTMAKRVEAACKRDIPKKIGRAVRMSKCTRQLMDGFVEDLDHAGVTALHDAQ